MNILDEELDLEWLAEEIVATYVTVVRSKARLMVLIGDFDQMGLANECGATSTAAWLIRRLGVSESTAHEYVSVARQLNDFPYLTEMFLDGNLSYSAVRLLLKYLTADNEFELVKMGMELNYHGLESALAGKQKPNEAKEEGREYYLRLKQEADGGLKLWGRLNAADGEAFKAALKIGHLASAAEDGELEKLLGGDGVVDNEKVDELIHEKEKDEEARQAKREVSGFGLPTPRALVFSLMGIVNMARTKPISTLRAPGAHVNVMMTVDGRAYLPNNAGATTETLEHLVSNALVRLDTVSNQGLILNTGRSTRLATDGQVNALMAMWGGQCATPGCTHRRFMEMHHIRDWAEGGMTDLDNLLPLCSGCHSLVTEGYTTITRNGHEIVFEFRDGSKYVSYNHSLPVRNDGYETADLNEPLWADSFAG
ncbi:DUF222 domain-containing protein [Corynebacterium genitalium ATCC 33030]|uniref:HNH endonuclease signature motif containing protein n=1 Tax=Corynebacterium TaxID=1716 RepID=UPI00031459C8|nr:DUF222 domain-containing protein [Corynebacterium genitalium]MCQ4620854.1 DUF222 domain-containing protein [Corynebacterium sp. CCUG 71335]UUA89967.1 DUF222 domain-containing protein [Corynebacterium genitalium ATCC 33030]